MIEPLCEPFKRLKHELGFQCSIITFYKKHRHLAEFRFNIEIAKSNLENAYQKTDSEVNDQFAVKIASSTEAQTRAFSQLSKANRIFELFSRNFKYELQPIYEEFNQLHSAISAAYVQRGQAQNRLNSAKDDIDAWHRKSKRYFLGNKGRKIPRSSIFGQSMNDLYSYKMDRDSAWEDIKSAKVEIDLLKDRKNKVRRKIQSVKNDQSEMHKLKNEGITRNIAADAVEYCKDKYNTAIQNRIDVENACDIFRKNRELANKISPLTALLKTTTSNHNSFLKTFTDRDAQARRRRIFERAMRKARKSSKQTHGIQCSDSREG